MLPKLAHLMAHLTAIHAAIYMALARQCRARLAEAPRHSRSQPQSQVSKRLGATTSRGAQRSTKMVEGATVRQHHKHQHQHQQQDQERPRPVPSQIGRLLGLERLARAYNLACILCYALYLMRRLLSRFLGLRWLANLQLLDCFLLGRVRTIGRKHLIGELAVAMFEGLFLLYRFHLMFLTPAGFKFHVFEFLLHDYEHVLANELSYGRRRRCCPNLKPRQQQDQGLDLGQAHDEGQGQAEAAAAAARLRALPTLGRRAIALEAGADFNADKSYEADCPASEQQYSPTYLWPYAAAASETSFARNEFAHGDTRSLFYLPNVFKDELDQDEGQLSGTGSGSGQEWILRPNRTGACWILQARFSALCLLILIYMLLANCGWLLLTTTASLLTPSGFESFYPVCARWLQRSQQAELAAWNRTAPGANLTIVNGRTLRLADGRELQVKFAAIYATLDKGRLACDKPIGEAPVVQLLSDDARRLPLSWYTLALVLADALQSSLFFFDFTLNFGTHSFVLMLMSLDVILNSIAIRHRLAQLVVQLLEARHHDHAQRIEFKHLNVHSELPAGVQADAGRIQARGAREARFETLNRRPSPWQGHMIRKHRALNGEIVRLQSILMDHFALIKSYNQFVSYYLFLLLLTLFGFSSFFAVFILTLRDRAIELEFFCIELLSILFLVYLLAGPCAAHFYSGQLYATISSAMALDSINSPTKYRWLTLMGYFQPAPLYCFTLFNRTPVSWLYCLKLISWSFSAIIVLASFLYVR